MSKVHILNVQVGPTIGNPAPFTSQIEFEITFECIEALPEDLVWKIIYVGSGESEEYDQILDTVYVGPIPEGRHKFIFAANSPDPQKIPISDLIDVTVVLLTCAYRGQEFIRIGYYVNNGYTDPELQENPPATPQYDKLQRNILASNPRINKVKINWEKTGVTTLQQELEASTTPFDNTTQEAADAADTEKMDTSADSANSSAMKDDNIASSPTDKSVSDSTSQDNKNETIKSEEKVTESNIPEPDNKNPDVDSTKNEDDNMTSIDKALNESISAFNNNSNNSVS